MPVKALIIDPDSDDDRLVNRTSSSASTWSGTKPQQNQLQNMPESPLFQPILVTFCSCSLQFCVLAVPIYLGSSFHMSHIVISIYSHLHCCLATAVDLLHSLHAENMPWLFQGWWIWRQKKRLLDVQFTGLLSSESGPIIRVLTGTGANGGDCEMLKDILWHREYCTHLPWAPSRSLCWQLRVVSQ